MREAFKVNLITFALVLLVACGSEDENGPDTDGDGIQDRRDNCVTITNPDQANTDGDSAGDACDALPEDATETKNFDGDDLGDNADPDDDNDSYNDDVDAFPYDATEWADIDGDNIGDNKDLDLDSTNPNAIKMSRLVETGRATKFIGEYGNDDYRLGLLGSKVKNIGDVNKDGLPDLLIGHYRVETNGVFTGTAYLMFGQASGFTNEIDLADLSNIPHIKIQPNTEMNVYAGIGADFEGIGDVNGDGIDDFMISALFTSTPDVLLYHGEVYVVYGREDWSQGNGQDGILTIDEMKAEGITFTGGYYLGQLGQTISKLGDINNDGFIDIGVSETTHAENAANLDQFGRVHILFGGDHWQSYPAGSNFLINDINNDDGLKRVEMNGTNDSEYLNYADGWGFGRDLMPLGDFNGDGIDDVAISQSFTVEWTSIGVDSVFVIFGQASADWSDIYSTEDLTADRAFVIQTDESDFATDMGSDLAVGDFNGDGVSDLALATWGKVAGNNSFLDGYVSIYWGGRGGWPSTMTREDLTEFYGVNLKADSTDTGIGPNIIGLPDQNGDGYDELIVSTNKSEFHNFESEGMQESLYQVYGKETWMDGTIGVNSVSDSLFQIQLNDFDGGGYTYLHEVGDMNGDGLADYVVVDPQKSSNGLTYNSEVFLVYGYERLYPDM